MCTFPKCLCTCWHTVRGQFVWPLLYYGLKLVLRLWISFHSNHCHTLSQPGGEVDKRCSACVIWKWVQAWCQIHVQWPCGHAQHTFLWWWDGCGTDVWMADTVRNNARSNNGLPLSNTLWVCFLTVSCPPWLFLFVAQRLSFFSLLSLCLLSFLLSVFLSICFSLSVPLWRRHRSVSEVDVTRGQSFVFFCFFF